MFVYGRGKVKESRPSPKEFREYSPPMAKREPTTEELQRLQHDRTTEEHEAIPNSLTPDEERQHRRRAEKSAYLERMLAKRQRSEHHDEDDG